MASIKTPSYKSWTQILKAFALTFIGTFVAAFSLEAFLLPNKIIDGGIVGIAMIGGTLTERSMISIYFVLLNLPFIYLAYRSVGRTFVIQMVLASLTFSGWLWLLDVWHFMTFRGDMLEVIVIGGLMLGIGLGMVIRAGGCVDGTEILAIILNKRWGFTVGQVVLGCNVLIFVMAGFVFDDWHSAIYSFMTFIIAIQAMDKVIVGLDETKSVTIISGRSKEVTEAILHDMGLGLTVMHGRGGFSGKEQDVLYVIIERLQLNELKELVYSVDPQAFLTVSTLHEISTGAERMDPGQLAKPRRRRTKRKAT